MLVVKYTHTMKMILMTKINICTKINIHIRIVSLLTSQNIIFFEVTAKRTSKSNFTTDYKYEELKRVIQIPSHPLRKLHTTGTVHYR
jgi:hypothetical protein